MFLREPTDGHMVRMTGFGLYCAQYSTFSAKINDLRPIPDLYGALSVISPSTGLNRQALFGSDRVWIRSGADLTRLLARRKGSANQSPVPGSLEKYFSNLPSMPSKSFASGGWSFFWVMLGQLLAYSVFTSSHFSRPGSVSGLMASAGHSGSHTPQSMHSSGWITSMLSPS